MALNRMCDRCGKNITDYDNVLFSLTKRPFKALIYWGAGRQLEFDLCEKCAQDVKRFIVGDKTKEDT